MSRWFTAYNKSLDSSEFQALWQETVIWHSASEASATEELFISTRSRIYISSHPQNSSSPTVNSAFPTMWESDPPQITSERMSWNQSELLTKHSSHIGFHSSGPEAVFLSVTVTQRSLIRPGWLLSADLSSVMICSNTRSPSDSLPPYLSIFTHITGMETHISALIWKQHDLLLHLAFTPAVPPPPPPLLPLSDHLSVDCWSRV